MVYDILQQIFVNCIFLFTFSFFLVTNKGLPKVVNRRYAFTLGLCSLLVVLESVCFGLLHQAAISPAAEYPTMIKVFLTFTLAVRYFLLCGLAILLCIPLVKRMTLPVALYLSVPGLFCTFLLFLCLFTPWMFTVSEDGVLTRGPLVYLTYGCMFLYAAWYFALSVRLFCKKQNGLLHLGISLLFPAWTLLELTGQVCFLGGSTITLILTFCFLERHSSFTSTDALTGCVGRRYFYIEAGRLSAYTLFSADLNDLKIINDTWGHNRGDEALAAVGQRLKETLSAVNATVFRMGGDEFAALTTVTDTEKLDTLLASLETSMEQTPYRVAVAYTVADGQESVDTVLARADREMYRKKAQMKAAALPSEKKEVSLW